MSLELIFCNYFLSSILAKCVGDESCRRDFLCDVCGANRFCVHILNHTSNAKSNRSFNITYIVSSIVTQFYQKLKHLFLKIKGDLHRSIIPF